MEKEKIQFEFVNPESIRNERLAAILAEEIKKEINFDILKRINKTANMIESTKRT